MSDIDDLATNLEAAKNKNNPEPTSGRPEADAESRAGMGVGISMAASIFVCAGLGVALDHWAGSAPWGLIGFLILGIAAAFYSVYKASKG